MKFLALISIIVLVCAGQGLATEQTMLARVTVYWHAAGKQQQACSNGGILREGHCAVDPKRIPYGSNVIFPDGPCVAVDTGPAVVSRKAARLSGMTALQRGAIVIDRYFESKRTALAWAASHPHFMNVHVLDPHWKAQEKAEGAAQPLVVSNRTFTKAAQFPGMPDIERLIDVSSKREAVVAPTDIRGPLVPTFLIGYLPGS